MTIKCLRRTYAKTDLSTLTELDYDKSLNSIEESFDDNPETSWQARAKVKHLRKSPCYNFELEVIAKNENNDVVGHVLLIEVEINSDDKTYYGLAIASYQFILNYVDKN